MTSRCLQTRSPGSAALPRDRQVVARLRKVTRDRGQFPSGQAALKVLYLAVRNLEEFRGRNAGIRSSGCHHQRLMVLR